MIQAATCSAHVKKISNMHAMSDQEHCLRADVFAAFNGHATHHWCRTSKNMTVATIYIDNYLWTEQETLNQVMKFKIYKQHGIPACSLLQARK